MARVVPSLIVAAIDTMFPEIAEQASGNQGAIIYDGTKRLSIAALLQLLDELPSEFLMVDSARYTVFISSVAAIREALATWRSGHVKFTLYLLDGAVPVYNPVTHVREVLRNCPDEIPAVSTLSLLFIPDGDLRNSIRLDISAANANLLSGEWKGGTVLAGSAIEALLLWAIQEHERQHPGTSAAAGAARVARKRLNRQPDTNPERWALDEYIEVAEELQLIEPETARQARQAKDFRNLIHPGRAARLGQKCDRATALAAIAALEFVVRDLTP
jgi:hypothetical protein